MNDKNELSLNEAAKLLNVSKTTAWRMVQRGKIKRVNEPNPALERDRVIVDKASVEKLVPKPETK